MSGGRDDDRERPSWREIDRMRGAKRTEGEPRPRGRWAEAQARRASEQYVKSLDAMFSAGQGGAEGEALASAVREAHGTPGFADACRAYRDGAGWPADVALVGLFLDADDTELVAGMLDAILDALRSGTFEATKGVRQQIRSLSESFDAAIADRAEEILEQL